VSYGHEPRLAAKFFHLHIKDHVTSYFLVGWRDSLFTIYDLECNTDVIHIFPDCILPEIVAIFLIQFHSFTPCLGDLNPKLVSAFVVPLVHRGNCPVTLLQDMGYPPSKCRLIMQVLGRGILSHFNGFFCFRSANRSQDVVQSFHSTHKYQPFVVFLICLLLPTLIYMSARSTACP
jgi:hypothetical protein